MYKLNHLSDNFMFVWKKTLLVTMFSLIMWFPFFTLARRKFKGIAWFVITAFIEAHRRIQNCIMHRETHLPIIIFIKQFIKQNFNFKIYNNIFKCLWKCNIVLKLTPRRNLSFRYWRLPRLACLYIKSTFFYTKKILLIWI